MKRILFFSLTYHPFIGGAEVAIKETTDRIDPKEYAFDMITLRFDSNLPNFERVGNIDIFRIGFARPGANTPDFKKFPLVLNKYLYPFWALAKAIVLHRRKPYDAVCSVMTSYSSFAALFFKYVFPTVPYIVRSDDGDPIDYLKRRVGLLYPFFERVFTKANYAIAASTYLERFVRSMGYQGPLAIVPNGVNAAHFSQEYLPAELESLKHNLGKKEDDVYLITTSRLVKKNACDDVIRALPLLPPHVSFLIFGTGPDEVMLRALAKELGVGDRARFMGQIGHEDMPKYLKASDIYIRPSLSEGFGIVFIEAMAAGLPVIATQEGGIADFLFDAKRNPDKPTTGWAVDKNAPEQIAEAVKDIIAHPEEVARVRAIAKEMAFEKYDWDLIARQMREAFDRVFEKSAKIPV
ncbi:MAG: glycosyltransferase family 4 protein [Candidatus Pacebacteria bacterium]|nr:glycosyltransferase family 4 protein [Candidatus Paceibacterota bacterium]